MTTTFVPTLSGRIVEITEGSIYAADWTLSEAVDRCQRLCDQVDEYSTEAVLAAHNGADPAPFVLLAKDSLAMAEGIRAAIARFQ